MYALMLDDIDFDFSLYKLWFNDEVICREESTTKNRVNKEEAIDVQFTETESTLLLI